MKLTRMIAAATLASGVLVAGFTSPAFAGANFQTEVNLNLRECQYVSSSCPVLVVIPKGTGVYLNCWASGTAVNGNTVWYNAFWTHNGTGYNGMVAGDYMNTGHDPNPSISRCG